MLYPIVKKKIKSYLDLKELLKITTINKLNILSINRNNFISAYHLYILLKKYYKNYTLENIKKELNFEIHHYKCQNEFFTEISNYFLEKYNIHPYTHLSDTRLRKKKYVKVDKFCHSKFLDIHSENYEYDILKNVNICSVYRCKKISHIYLKIKRSLTLKALVN